MKLKQIIADADELRPNDIDAHDKAKWLMELETDIAEMMGKDPPENTYPSDRDMLLPDAYCDAYRWHLVAMISLSLAETGMYQVDYAAASSELARAKAWWGRNNRKKTLHNWRTL